MTTALDVIKSSLRLLRVGSDDIVITDAEAKYALEALNQMLGGWSNESLMMYHMAKEPFTLTAGQSSYTIGSGGDFNTTRPIAIDGATLSVNGVDWPVQTMAFDDWGAVRLKALTTGFVEYLYMDNTYPLGTIYVHPVPSTNFTSILTLYTRKPFTEFANLTSTVNLPAGYVRAMKYQLALELAPEYQTTADPSIIALAISSKAAIKRTNKRPVTSQIDPALLTNSGRRYNIYRGN